MSFQDLTIKPVQRLMKYQLILKDCLKIAEKCELHNEVSTLKESLELMINTPAEANDMMLVSAIKPYEMLEKYFKNFQNSFIIF